MFHAKVVEAELISLSEAMFLFLCGGVEAHKILFHTTGGGGGRGGGRRA